MNDAGVLSITLRVRLCPQAMLAIDDEELRPAWNDEPVSGSLEVLYVRRQGNCIREGAPPVKDRERNLTRTRVLDDALKALLGILGPP
jgi:hypothetical protein